MTLNGVMTSVPAISVVAELVKRERERERERAHWLIYVYNGMSS